MTIAQILKHDFTKGSLDLHDSNGNRTYFETSDGFWWKQEYDTNDKVIYFENSDGSWYKQEYDTNGNETYFESSSGSWYKREYDTNDKEIYFENSDGSWYKRECDINGNEIYFESSSGTIRDYRPKVNSDKLSAIRGLDISISEIDELLLELGNDESIRLTHYRIKLVGLKKRLEIIKGYTEVL